MFVNAYKQEMVAQKLRKSLRCLEASVDPEEVFVPNLQGIPRIESLILNLEIGWLPMVDWHHPENGAGRPTTKQKGRQPSDD
jgi:hypothetical protein